MRILGSLLFIVTLLFAQFRVYLDQNPIIQGEPAKLVIEGVGKDVQLPKPAKIGPYPVASSATEESFIQINSKLQHIKKEVVTFYPSSDVTIPSFQAKIDGKIYRSKPLKLLVKPPAPDSNVRFTLKLNKQKAYVGEPIVATYTLKIRRSVKIIDYAFNMPNFDNFWVKEIKSKEKPKMEGEYFIKRISFLLIPQRGGVLNIPPALFKYATASASRDVFGFSITTPKWKSVASNAAKVVAKALPKDVDLVGDFTITAVVDKDRVKANEPVNLTVTIQGYGNAENFEGVELNISNATVYANKPQISESIQGERLYTKFVQNISIISDENFTIPALHIPFFHLSKERIEYLKTKPFYITVKGAKKYITEKNTLPSTPTNAKKATSSSGWIWFGAGLVAGMVLACLLFFVYRFWRIKKVPRLSSKKELLKRLLANVDKDPKIASLAQALYEEIYEGKRGRLKRKEIEKMLKGIDKG